MRGHAAKYDLSAQPTLEATLKLLAQGRHTPISGGTELMVALSAGRLPLTPLLSISHLRELRFIREEPGRIVLGSGCTFTDLRRNPAVGRELPLLAQAASWTGSIANQNRGTLGGNMVNASPAADAPPALLCYDAEVTLISAAGTRTMPYTEFHLGYKKTALLPGELLYSVAIAQKYRNYLGYIRKVGTRNAQAISKVALAALVSMDGKAMNDVRLAAASLGEIPMRCSAVEKVLTGQQLTPELIAAARAALTAESKPIDDIRSTAAYRTAVACNLLEELLQRLLHRPE